MMWSKLILLCGLLTGLAWPCFGQAEVLEANIQTVWRGDTLQIAAWATNLSEAREEDLHYQLLVTRLDGRGNRSTSRQGGSLGLMPNEQLLLARSLVNLPMPARAEVQLLITRPDGAVVASDELTVMAAPPSTTNTPLRQGEGPRSTDAEDIELSGIFILDNTRTRAGHDFYDLFYQAVGQPELSGSFQLVLEELPGMGISSTLQIFLNGQLQFENRLTPQYDYLQELATLAAQVMLSRMANYDQLQQDLELEGTGIY